VDSETISKYIGEWSKNIPDSFWYESKLRNVHVCTDSHSANVYIRGKFPGDYGLLDKDNVVEGFYDPDTMSAVVNLYESCDDYDNGDGNSGRNFYHEFAHSIQSSQSKYDNDWLYSDAYNEWSVDLTGWSGESERFAEAFSEYMVAKYYYEKLKNKGRFFLGNDETYMEELRRMRPKTVALFEEWGL
jgi:hypothetical protein